MSKEHKEHKEHAVPQQSHAVPQQSEEKLHGEALNNAIPAPDNGSHARSAAAHLDSKNTHDHTKPVGDLRHYEQEREPPQEVSRAGKQYRRQ